MAKCAKHNCQSPAAEGKPYCAKHKGAGWGKRFNVFKSENKPVRRPK